MICPNCGHDNLPVAEECSSCQQDLTQLDDPVASNRVERSLMEDPVGTLQRRKPVVILPTATIQEALHAMLGAAVGALPVVNEAGKLVRILSERDLLAKAAGQRTPCDQRLVREFMPPDPEAV